ncbi:hypothetical protein [Sorangium sp. So ce1099]|uniref:hypothetical protein n=1 Tax=Sorangium sp. So ce1099 TaxID=3133331 RepID=UPI003F61AEC4
MGSSPRGDRKTGWHADCNVSGSEAKSGASAKERRPARGHGAKAAQAREQRQPEIERRAELVDSSRQAALSRKERHDMSTAVSLDTPDTVNFASSAVNVITQGGHLLPAGVVDIIDPSTAKVIGSAYTETTSTGQLQRWLLHRSPQNNFQVQLRPGGNALHTLACWRSYVAAPNNWSQGSIYVWAKADVYEYGGTYNGQKWNKIPPAPALPLPTYFDQNAASAQLDQIWSKYIDLRQVDVNKQILRGLGFVQGALTDATSVEYWFLPAGYQSTSGFRAIQGKKGPMSPIRSLDGFVAAANNLWCAGSQLLIVGCLNHHGSTPPALP